MKKPAYYYQICRRDDRNIGSSERFVHLEVQILVPRYNYCDPSRGEMGLDLKTFVSVQWQGHYQDGGSEWYARRWSIDEHENADKILEAAKLIAKITKSILGDDQCGRFTGDELLSTFFDMKMERVVLDPRTGNHARIADVFPPEYEVWVMDWERVPGWTHNMGGLVMATDEEHARRKLLDDQMQKSEWSGAESRFNTLTQWANAGKPVRRTYRNHGIKLEDRSVEMLLRSPKDEAAAKAKAEEVAA